VYDYLKESECVRCLGCCMIVGEPEVEEFWDRFFVSWLEIPLEDYTHRKFITSQVRILYMCPLLTIDRKLRTTCLIYENRPLTCKLSPEPDQRASLPKACPYRKEPKLKLA
jgi:Fe-S-cluster containining protein